MTEDFEFRQATDRRVRDLEHRLTSLEHDQQSMREKFGDTDDLDYELGRIRNGISDCEDRTDILENRADSLEEDLERIGTAERAVERLAQHVRLLEGQIIAAGGAPAADLDTFTKDQRVLAGTMQSGWTAADALLSDHSRNLHQARVDRFRDTDDKNQAVRKQIIELIGELTGHRYGTTGHTEAAAQLRSAIEDESTLRESLDQQNPGAGEAVVALAADTAARADKQPAIAAGAWAEQRLTLVLRSRLADAISSRSLLPAWFATALGSAPPAQETDSWVECATRLLLYRLTYGIDDQVVALGPAPTAASRHRHHWYDKLRNDLRRW